MAITVSNKQTSQLGTRCFISGRLNTDSVSDDDGEIIKTSDFDMSPFGKEFAKLKLIRFGVSGTLASVKLSCRIEWTATSPANDDYITFATMHDKVWSDQKFDFLPDGGVVNPMNPGATGGITFYRDVLTSGSVNDQFFFIAELEAS